jgi:hypothetical protein
LAAEFLLLDVRSASPSARNNWRDFAMKLILRVVISLKAALPSRASSRLKGDLLDHNKGQPPPCWWTERTKTLARLTSEYYFNSRVCVCTCMAVYMCVHTVATLNIYSV